MHIDYKATIWFRIPIEQREVLDKCIDILMSGGTINDLYNDIDENDIGPCEILYDTEEQISPQENQDNPTIEAHIDKEGTMDTEIIWQNFDYDADISPKDTVNQDSDIYSECERLASQYKGDNLLPLLLAAVYVGKAEGINETIAKQNEQFKSA